MRDSDHHFQRFISLLLVLAMLVNTLPLPLAQAWAKDQHFSVQTASGESIAEDESWEELYPNGTFAFAEAQLSLKEGEAAQALTIYRLGGGLGEAVVTVQLTPPTDQNNLYYAASSEDYRILEPVEGVHNSDLYSNVEIELVFAEDEFEKRILIEPVDDIEHEATEFLLATIIDVQGATFTETANRATIIINDNEEIIPSIASFKETMVIADRNEQNAVLTVQRSEGLQYLFSVDYITGENNAIPGTDYAHTEGTLIFEPGETEKTIAIPLVQDYIYRAEAELNFFVGLTDPRTGSIDEASQIAGVHLVNSYGEAPDNGTVSDDVYANVEGSVYDEVYGDIEGSVYDEVEELIFSTPNLITLLAMDNDKQAQVSTSTEALIGNPEQNLEATQRQYITNDEPADSMNTRSLQVAPMTMQSVMPLAASSGSTFIMDSNTVAWTPYVVMADRDNKYRGSQVIYDSDSAFDYHFVEGTKSIERIVANSSYPNTQWFETRAGMNTGQDPTGFYMTKKPIDNLYEYYKQLDYKVWFYISSTKNRGYFGLGEPSDKANNDAIKDKKFFSIAWNGNSARDNWYKDHTAEATIDLKNYLSKSSATNYNNINKKYPVIGVYDYDKDNNSDFRVDLIRFALRRASLVNLSVEHSSNDGFAAASSFKPKTTVINGGIDSQTQNPYIGSTILIEASETAGCYKVKSAVLQLKTGSNSYTTISTATPATSGKGLELILKSDNSSENTRMNQLSCKTVDSSEYRIFVTYESVKNISISIAEALAKDSTKDIHTIEALKRATDNQIGINNQGASSANNMTNKTTTLDGKYTDLQSINFGLDEDYIFIYNGQMYKGNQNIPITISTNEQVTLPLSHRDLLSKAQTVKILSIDSVRIYRNTGTNESPNRGELLNVISPGSYDETLFAPEAGKMKIMEIEYTKQPYVFVHADNLGLLPLGTKFEQQLFFDHLSLNPLYNSQLEAQAPDLLQKRPIDLLFGSDKIDIIGLDAVTGVAYIPLGGDVSNTEDSKDYKKWDPTWTGKLSARFTPKGIDGKAKSSMHHEALGWWEVASESKPGELEAFLGSFLPYDTQIIDIVYEDSLQSTFPTDISAKRKFIPQSFMDSPAINPDNPNDKEKNSITQTKVPEDKSNSMQRSAQPKVEMPELNIELEMLNISVAGEELLISIGIPLFSASSSSGSSDTSDSNGSSGYFASKMQDYQEALNKLKEFMKLIKAGRKVEVAPKADYDVSFDVGLSINILMTYSEMLGTWQFDQALFLVKIGGSVSISQKLPPPVSFIYVYVVFGADFTISTGLGMKEIVNDKGVTERTVFFKGIILEPALFAEVGLGIGLDGLLSIEIYFKMNIGMKASIAVYDPVTETFSSTFDTFSLRGALGFRVELVIFTYEMDVVGFKIDYNRNRTGDKWKFSKVLFEQSTNFSPFAAQVGGGNDSTTEPIQIVQSTAIPGSNDQIGAKLYRTPRRTNQQLGFLGEISNQAQSGDTPLVQTFGFGSGEELADDFSLGAYNASSAAYKMGDSLGESTTLRLAEVSNSVYMFYHIDSATENRKALVFSELDTSVTPYNMVAPLGIGSEVYSVVYSQMRLDDGAFDIASVGDRVYIAWVQQKPELVIPERTSPTDELALVSENNVLLYSYFDAAAKTLAEPIIVSEEATSVGAKVYSNEYLPQIVVDTAGKVTISYMKTTPYTPEERKAIIAKRVTELGYYQADEVRQREILSETLLQELMLSINGAKSDLVLATMNAEGTGFVPTTIEIAKVAETEEPYKVSTVAYSNVTAHKLWLLDGGELAFSYIIEYPTTDVNSKVTLKNLYLGFADGSDSLTLKRLFSLIDYESESDSVRDAVYQDNGHTLFADPFFGDIGFGKAKLTSGSPEEGEDYFYFNLNGIHYYLDSSALTSLEGNGAAVSNRLFDVPEDQLNDGMAGVRLVTKKEGSDKGTLAAIAVQSVAYTSNNAIFVFEYDAAAQQWSEGRPLAMRGLNAYEQLRSGAITQAEAEAAYYKDSGSSLHQLNFTNPSVLITTDDNLLILTEASKIELEEKEITIDKNLAEEETFTQLIPKLEQTGMTYTMTQADKQLYALHYQNAGLAITDHKLSFDDELLLPGKKVVPYISFTNIGSRSLKDPVIKLMLEDKNLPLVTWDIDGSIPAGSVYSLSYAEGTLLPSEWSELAGKKLYFDVSSSDSIIGNSSLSTPQGYVEAVSEAELLFSSSQYRIGNIVTENGARKLALDLDLQIQNAGSKNASNVTLHAYSEERVIDTSPDNPLGYTISLEAVDIFDGNSVLALGALEAGSVFELSYKSNDYIVRSIDDTTYEQVYVPSNDLYIPAQYFQDGSCKLVFEVATSSTEISSANNQLSINLGPVASIEVQDILEISTNSSFALPFSIETLDGNIPQLLVTERPSLGKERILSQISLASGHINLTAVKEGETVLHLQLEGLPVFKDVLIRANGAAGSATIDTTKPIIDIIEPADFNFGTTQKTALNVRYSVYDDGAIDYITDPTGSRNTNQTEQSFTIMENGLYTITAADKGGNIAKHVINMTSFDHYNEKKNLIEELRIFDVTYNGQESISETVYLNTNISLRFAAESPDGLDSVQVIVYSEDAPNEAKLLIDDSFTNSMLQKAFTVSLSDRGTYHIIVRDKANSTVQGRFEIHNLDKVKPDINAGRADNQLLYTISDDVYLSSAKLTKDGTLVADLIAQAVVLSSYEASGSIILSNYGTYHITATDIAGNESTAELHYGDPAMTPWPVPRVPVPTLELKPNQQISFDANTVATSTHDGDSLSIIEVNTMPNGNLVEINFDAATGIITLKGLREGTTSIGVLVENSEFNTVIVNVPIKITSSGTNYVNPNPPGQTSTAPQPSNRLTIKVAGLDITLKEENGGRKAVISMSSQQLKALIEAEENPLVFDIREVSKAVEVAFSRNNLKALAEGGKSIRIVTVEGSITLDPQALLSICEQAGVQVSFLIEAITADNLPEDLPEAQRDKILALLEEGIPVFDISVFSGKQFIHEFEGQISVDLPYQGLFSEQSVVWYIDEAGELSDNACSFNSEAETVRFQPPHLSYYAIGEKEAAPEQSEKPQPVEEPEPAADPPIVLTIDSTLVKQGDARLASPPVAPQILGDRTMLPFRYLIQTLLGGEVDWDEETRSVTATINGHTFWMTIGTEEIVIDGRIQNFGQAPVIVNDYTLVPLRAFEAAVTKILWDEASRTVSIYP